MDVEKLFAKEENHVANVKDDVTTGVGLAAALASNQTLTTLDLSRNAIRAIGAQVTPDTRRG